MALETIIILVLACLFGFYMAWSIGANDVANAMGTSVGSGALTLRRAVVVAAILEFSGAFLVGGHVTDTVRKGMIDLEAIPEARILMFGMLASLLAAAIWLQFATYLGWPVSTTQSIIGAIVGFGLVVVGFGAIRWGGVTAIFVSWIVSPVLSAVIAFTLFSSIRRWIMEARDPVQAMHRWAPWLIFIVFQVLILVITFKGLKNLKLNLGFGEAFLVAVAVSSVAALIGGRLVRRIRESEVLDPAGQQLAADEERRADAVGREPEIGSETDNSVRDGGEAGKHDLTPIREKSYIFIEKVFKYLQILSACTVAFAHGANDVANAVGPLATVWEIALTGKVSPKVPVHPLLLALGGLGIAVGLATWGWRIIETLGRKITEMTPTRGFSAEFGAACTILMASRMGLPVSTTHCLVGAVMGVGLARGLSSLNLRMLRQIAISWIIEIPVTAVLAILIFYGLTAIF